MVIFHQILVFDWNIITNLVKGYLFALVFRFDVTAYVTGYEIEIVYLQLHDDIVEFIISPTAYEFTNMVFT